MAEKYKNKTITLPEDLLKKSIKTFENRCKKPFNRITFSEVVREALYDYNRRYGK